MRNNKIPSVNTICCFLIVIAFFIVIITKSSVTFLEFISFDWQFDIKAIKEIVFNICIGIIASAFLTILIEWRNKLAIQKRNIEVKKVIMRNFAFLARKTLYELNSGTDRDLLSVIYHYHHLEFLVSKRLVKLKADCKYFIENYIQIFDTEEIDLLNDIILKCQYVQDLTNDSYKQHMLSYDSLLSRYYSSEKYQDLPLRDSDKIDYKVIKDKKNLDDIVSTNKKYVNSILELLKKLQQQMPYIFES